MGEGAGSDWGLGNLGGKGLSLAGGRLWSSGEGLRKTKIVTCFSRGAEFRYAVIWYAGLFFRN